MVPNGFHLGSKSWPLYMSIRFGTQLQEGSKRFQMGSKSWPLYMSLRFGTRPQKGSKWVPTVALVSHWCGIAYATMFGTFKPECEKGLSFRFNVPSIVAYIYAGGKV